VVFLFDYFLPSSVLRYIIFTVAEASGGKGRTARKADNLTVNYEPVI
jgi:hypothetical protein